MTINNQPFDPDKTYKAVGLGLRVQGSGFRGLGVWGLGLRFRVWSRVWGLNVGFSLSGCRA